MHLDSLKVFFDVARLRSFSQAALENHLSQSAVSQIVHQLEKRLRVQLINRLCRPLRPTALGKAYAEGCRAILQQYADLEASIRGTRAAIAGTVRVAAIYSVGLSDMGETVEQFSQMYPQAEIHLEYLHPDRVYEKVLDGTADLGLVSFPRKSRDLVILPWRNEEMVLVCSPAHPLSRQRVIRPRQLRGERYIGFDKQLVIRREVDRYLRDRNVAVDVTVEFDNVENIKKAVEVGAGIALLPKPTLHREAEAGTLMAIPLSGRRLFRPLSILHRRQQQLGATALRFIELLRPPTTKVSVALAKGDTATRDGIAGPRQNKSPRRQHQGSAKRAY
jgi:DNA-binding transcriptional LysR family regulator